MVYTKVLQSIVNHGTEGLLLIIASIPKAKPKGEEQLSNDNPDVAMVNYFIP